MTSQVDTVSCGCNRIFFADGGFAGGDAAILVFYLITNKLILQPVRVLRETARRCPGRSEVRSHIFTEGMSSSICPTSRDAGELKESEDQLRRSTRVGLKMGQLAESNVALYESNRLRASF